jgi:hypothetical protein
MHDPPRTIDDWPPPATVRPALRRARRRYRRQRVPARPRLAEPTSCLGLFPRRDLVALVLASYWPLPAAALRWIAEARAARARRRQRLGRRTADVVRRVLAEELPPALPLLLSRLEGRRDRGQAS